MLVMEINNVNIFKKFQKLNATALIFSLSCKYLNDSD